jgi:hypothetical protein
METTHSSELLVIIYARLHDVTSQKSFLVTSVRSFTSPNSDSVLCNMKCVLLDISVPKCMFLTFIANECDVNMEIHFISRNSWQQSSVCNMFTVCVFNVIANFLLSLLSLKSVTYDVSCVYCDQRSLFCHKHSFVQKKTKD